MDKQAFKQRMQNLKSYRENNPGKGYWDWKVQAYQNGGRHALGVGQVFASLADMLFNKERRTPAIAAAAYYTIHQTQNDPVLAPVEAPLVEPIADAIKSVDETPYDPGEVFLLSPENQKKQMTKNPNYRVVDTNSEEDPYGIVRRAANYHKEIHGEVPVYEYIADSDTTIKRSNLIPVGTLPLGEYTPELPHAGSYNSVLYYNASNDKLYQRAYDLNDYGPTDTKDKGASSMYIGPIRWLSRQLDKAGTPFVQRTGFVPLDEGKYYNQLPESAKKKVRERRRLRNSYEYGGEVNEFQRKTRRDIMQESLVDGRPDYNKMFQNQNEYQKDFANYWYTERAKNPKYSDQIGGDKLGSVLSNIDKATWKTPTEAMRDNMVGQGYNPTDAQINQQLNILKEKGTKGFANPKAHSYTSLRPTNTWHEGVGHMVGDNTPAILNATPNVRISNPDSSYEDYVNQANEKHAQTWDFRGNNSNLKDDQGNYYIDPNRQLTPEDISNMRSRGAKIPEQWESLEDADISELTNTFAYNMYQDPVQYMANGGEVGDPDDEFTKAINTKLGRTPDGRPLQQGLKPVFDLEDAANLTPVGDVLSAKEAYDAVKQNDWLGAGLAGLGFIPFIPKGVRRIARQTPTVNRTFEQKVAEMEKRVGNRRKMMEEFYDQRNRTYELLNTPEARRRAADIDQKYGTEYNKVYDELTKEYEDITSYVNMVEPEFVKDPDAFARIKPAKSGKKISLSEDNITKPEDFPTGLIRHEIGHYVDEMAYPGGVPNNAYLRQLGKPSKYRPFEEVKDIFRSPDKALQDYRYLRNPTEKKSIMNQFDEYLMNNYTPSTYPQTTKEFKEAIEKAPDIHRNMKLLLKIHNKYGGIHIKKKNRGKFTKSAKAAGQSVQEHAHSVMNNPKASTLQRRRANFAIQAKKWAKKRKKK